MQHYNGVVLSCKLQPRSRRANHPSPAQQSFLRIPTQRWSKYRLRKIRTEQINPYKYEAFSPISLSTRRGALIDTPHVRSAGAPRRLGPGRAAPEFGVTPRCRQKQRIPAVVIVRYDRGRRQPGGPAAPAWRFCGANPQWRS